MKNRRQSELNKPDLHFNIFLCSKNPLKRWISMYILATHFKNHFSGEMAEWLNAAVLKTVKDASPSGVRIPVSPHFLQKAFENE